MSVLSWIKGIFAAPVRIDESGDESAELEADVGEELPDAEEDRESLLRAEYAGGARQGTALELEFEPQTMAFEGAKAEASENDAEAEKPTS